MSCTVWYFLEGGVSTGDISSEYIYIYIYIFIESLHYFLVNPGKLNLSPNPKTNLLSNTNYAYGNIFCKYNTFHYNIIHYSIFQYCKITLHTCNTCSVILGTRNITENTVSCI